METTDMNTTEYLRHRGWDEKQATETKIKTTEGHYVTPKFMMEAFADYKLEKATQQTASQKQIIERLREALIETNKILDWKPTEEMKKNLTIVVLFLALFVLSCLLYVEKRANKSCNNDFWRFSEQNNRLMDSIENQHKK